MVFQFFFEGIFTPLLGILGVFGNLLSIKVLSSHHLDMTPSFRHLLRMLAAFDANFLIFTLALFCFGTWSKTYEHFIRPWVSPYMLPIVQISLTGSVWTTMAVSFERYFTVCLSYETSEFANSKKIYMVYTIPIIFCSFLFNIPRFFELRTEMKLTNMTIEGTNLTEEKMMPQVVMTEIRKNPSYSRDYVMIANFISLIVVPMLVLIILNTSIFRKISQANARHNAISSHQRSDHSVAKMLIILVLVFVICHSIRFIINLYECIQVTLHGKVSSWPSWLENLIHFNHFALVINSSINILIYCWRDKKFLHVMLLTCGLSSGQRSVGLLGRRLARALSRTERNPSQSLIRNSVSNFPVPQKTQTEMMSSSRSGITRTVLTLLDDEKLEENSHELKLNITTLHKVENIANFSIALHQSDENGQSPIPSDLISKCLNNKNEDSETQSSNNP